MVLALQQIEQINFKALVIALSVLVVIVGSKRVSRKIPGALIALVGAIASGISAAEAAGEIALGPLGTDAKAVATVVMQAMEGMKGKYLRGDPIEDDVRRMVSFVAGALTAAKS